MQERPDIWIRGGLLSPKHYRALSDAVWLYMYLLQEVNFTEGSDRGPAGWMGHYSHLVAMEALGCSLRTVKYWFERLRLGGYITTRRHRYSLEVTITKYQPPADRARERRARNGKSPAAPPEVRSEVQDLALVDSEKCNEKCKNLSQEVQPLVQDFALSSLDQKDKRSKEQTADAPNGAVQPWDVIAALCQETGTDPKTLTGTDRKIRGKYAKELLSAGYTIEQVVCCYRYLRQQRWRDGPVKLATVVKEIADWKAQGQPTTPEAERKAPATTNTEGSQERDHGEYSKYVRKVGG